MKNTLISGLILFTSFFGTVIADTTFGLGVGSLYNGLGLNVGRTSESSLVYGSLGCWGGSSGDINTSGNKYETNCGIGLGYISMLSLSGNNHGLGLSFGYSYDTDDITGGSEYHVMPGYHYFFNGASQLGLNLGFAAKLTRSDADSTDASMIFNLGYQF